MSTRVKCAGCGFAAVSLLAAVALGMGVDAGKSAPLRSGTPALCPGNGALVVAEEPKGDTQVKHEAKGKLCVRKRPF